MKKKMDDREIEFSDHILLLNSYSSNNIQESVSPYAETCTHTHTCDPPEGSNAHTCYHTHARVILSEEVNRRSPVSKPQRTLGNREAVRKYREKKKARVAYLEEEVKKLRLVNQLLMGKVEGLAILETEFLRLRSLLLDIGGKIDNELEFNSHVINKLGRGLGGSSDVIRRTEKSNSCSEKQKPATPTISD